MGSFGSRGLRNVLATAAWVAVAACSTVPPGAPPPSTAILSPEVVPPEALNPDVRQDNIHQTICVAGYSKSVRPSARYTRDVKAALMREQGLAPSDIGGYELDHRIALALGGHPSNRSNLALQPWDGDAGAHRKDLLERTLQRLVCADRLPLDEARRALYFDWQGAYRRFATDR